MAMSYSERMRYIQEEANQYLSRNKVRDSSELTLIRQAKASSVIDPNIVSATTNLHTNQLIPPYQNTSDCAANVVYKGVGTNNDYSGILKGKQNCAICSDDDPSINRYLTTQTWPCYNRLQPPFIQKNLSTAVTCKQGFDSYPRREAICYSNTNIYILPSAN